MGNISRDWYSGSLGDYGGFWKMVRMVDLLILVRRFRLVTDRVWIYALDAYLRFDCKIDR